MDQSQNVTAEEASDIHPLNTNMELRERHLVTTVTRAEKSRVREACPAGRPHLTWEVTEG